MKVISIVMIFLGFLFSTFGQTETILDQTKEAYKAFDFSKVISLTDTLNYKTISDTADTKELLTMRAVAFYSTGDQANARRSFFTLLSIDQNHKLDPSRISPKIISYFYTVKNEYSEMREDIERDTTPNESEKTDSDSISYQSERTFVFDDDLFAGSVARSFVLPGMGHVHSGMTTKGILLSFAAAATIGGYIYYSIETNSREEEYLMQIHPDAIASAYTNYDEAYQLRNYCLSAFAIIWVYAQMDLLFFSDDAYLEPTFIDAANPQSADYIGFHLNVTF